MIRNNFLATLFTTMLGSYSMLSFSAVPTWPQPSKLDRNSQEPGGVQGTVVNNCKRKYEGMEVLISDGKNVQLWASLDDDNDFSIGGLPPWKEYSVFVFAKSYNSGMLRVYGKGSPVSDTFHVYVYPDHHSLVELDLCSGPHTSYAMLGSFVSLHAWESPFIELIDVQRRPTEISYESVKVVPSGLPSLPTIHLGHHTVHIDEGSINVTSP